MSGPFGWDYPAGCTERDIERRFGDAPSLCEDCGCEIAEDRTQCRKCAKADDED